MKIGITGHQERPGINWDWVQDTVREELSRLSPPLVGLTSLAVGADQVFAKTVLELGGSIIAVIPRDHYEQYFKDAGLDNYRELLCRATHVSLHADDEQEAFLKAGLYVADHSDLLIAIWDGQPSQGKGGTGDVVQHAVSAGRPWIHIDPIQRSIDRHY